MNRWPRTLVSACLCGISCRYDGGSKPSNEFREMLCRGECLPFCPEVLGGLPTPRPAAVIISGDGFSVLDGTGRVVLRDHHVDVTAEFLRGAELSLRYAALVSPKAVYLKEKSPSCGIRCGGTMPGVAAAALIRSGYDVRPVP